MAVVTKTGFLQLHVVHQLHPYLDNAACAQSLMPQSFLRWFTACTLHGATLELSLEAAAGTECNDVSSSWDFRVVQISQLLYELHWLHFAFGSSSNCLLLLLNVTLLFLKPFVA